MFHPQSGSGSEEFPGFDQARTIMWCYEARARTHTRLSETDFLIDEAVMAVHVDNTSRADRVFLTAFDRDGQLLRGDTLYVDEPDQRLDITPEFDHDYNAMTVPAGSDLEQAVIRENGWIINMASLRKYEPQEDRRATQRAVFLAHLGDMMNSGQTRGFLFGDSIMGSSGSTTQTPGSEH
ncbi:hypothetical protein [Arthrobacter castelli]|uniref:hypothetical protein n=1 Tax=Arthrobacter castelli TaxID=271431 RepID=UPI00041FFB7C|nr:hypothetical protein [Arthrobacter castelli]